MSSDRPSARWRFLLTPRWLAWLGFVIAAVIGMLWLGLWQFRRAESGNALSWGYTFEWPLFAAFGLVFYVRTVLDEVRGRRGAKAAPAEASTVQASTVQASTVQASTAEASTGDPADGLPGRPPAAPAAAEEAPDPELDEYNAYLARLGQQAASRALRGWRR
jgi:DNA-binding transcriptional regulator of glucitol operon